MIIKGKVYNIADYLVDEYGLGVERLPREQKVWNSIPCRLFTIFCHSFNAYRHSSILLPYEKKVSIYAED